MRVAGTDLANIRSGILAEVIAAGDEVVEQIVRNGARHLGMAIAGVVNIIMRSSLIASAPCAGGVEPGAMGLQPAPKSDAMKPRSAIILMGARSGLTE